MVNNLDLYLLDHRERLQQSEKNRIHVQGGRRFSLRLPSLKQLRAFLFL